MEEVEDAAEALEAGEPLPKARVRESQAFPPDPKYRHRSAHAGLYSWQTNDIPLSFWVPTKSPKDPCPAWSSRYQEGTDAARELTLQKRVIILTCGKWQRALRVSLQTNGSVASWPLEKQWWFKLVGLIGSYPSWRMNQYTHLKTISSHIRRSYIYNGIGSVVVAVKMIHSIWDCGLTLSPLHHYQPMLVQWPASFKTCIQSIYCVTLADQRQCSSGLHMQDIWSYA